MVLRLERYRKYPSIVLWELISQLVLLVIHLLHKNDLYISISLSANTVNDTLTKSIKAMTYTHHHLGKPGPSSPP